MLDRIKRIISEGDVVQFPRKNQLPLESNPQSFKPGDIVFHPDLTDGERKVPHVVHEIVKGRGGEAVGARIRPLDKDIKKVDVIDDPTGYRDFKQVDLTLLSKASR